MPTLNPWIILGALLVVSGLCGVSYEVGHKHGVNAQKVADQTEFDRIAADIAKQKAEAADKYRKAQADILALQGARETFKTQLEKAHAANQDTTNRLRDAYAAYGLRFRTTEGAGCGGGSDGSVPAAGDATGAARSAVVELPAALARRIRSIAYDADQLADEYRLCRDYLNGLDALNPKGPAP